MLVSCRQSSPKGSKHEIKAGGDVEPDFDFELEMDAAGHHVFDAMLPRGEREPRGAGAAQVLSLDKRLWHPHATNATDSTTENQLVDSFHELCCLTLYTSLLEC